jgi:hypothetical protein
MSERVNWKPLAVGAVVGFAVSFVVGSLVTMTFANYALHELNRHLELAQRSTTPQPAWQLAGRAELP